MKTYNIKKIRKVFFLSVLIIGWTSFLLINSDESEPKYLEISEQKDMSYYSPSTSDFSGDNIIFQQLPDSDLLDNTEIINSFYNYPEDESIIYDRPPSIIATYFIVSMLDTIDHSLLLTQADKIFNYLIGNYNPETEMFEDNINYTYYNEHYKDGKNLLLAPYTPEISHEMALVILKKCDRLSFFSGDQIDNWIFNIRNTQNVDGGFGTLYSPNSTLLETYYAVECMLALNDYDIGIFFTSEKIVIRNFIEGRQRTSDWAPFGIGAFGEYSRDVFVGWEFFYASWMALNTIEMIGGDFSGVKDGFIDFIIDNGLNNPSTHCFYGQWNDRMSPHVITYYGTAILGDCIRILNAEAQFPDLIDSQSTMISANIIEKTGLDLDYNYFYWASDVPGDDLFSQYLIVNYLSNTGLWNLIDEQKFLDYYLSFITENGGGTYISNIWDSAKGDYLKFNSLKYSGINESQVFEMIMSKRFVSYFGDLRNISSNPQDQTYKILQHWNEWVYYPIATNYFSINLLDEYDLLDEFYNEVGPEYEDFINWIHGKLNSKGFFVNSPESMASGSLESTYYALESQRILLDYDELHDINDYYTPQEISSIISYSEQFVVEDDEFWYVNCSESLENEGIGRFQSINYVLSIENILNVNGIDYNKLENYLMFSYETQWDLLTLQEKTNLMILMKDANCSISDLNTRISHAQVRDIIQYTISQDHYPEDEINFISQLLKNSDIHVYMDVPSNQILDESYTYLAQFSSISSLISVENISIIGDDIEFSDWNSLGSMYACEVVPQFDDFTPYSWEVSIDFDYNEMFYSYPFSLDISIPFLTTVQIESNAESVISVLSVECPDSLAQELEPDLFIYNDAYDLVSYYQMVDMSINQGEYTMDFECDITEGLQENNNYTLVWNFNFDFLDNISVDFELAGEEEPPINNPPDLSNENTTNIENSTESVNFLITYSDPEGIQPDFVKLVIDDIEFYMEFISGDFQTGALYGINLNLSEGDHEYYFITGDLENTVRFPIDYNFLITIEETPEDPPNNPPDLSNENTSNIENSTTSVNFLITYSDPEGLQPDFVILVIDDIEYNMNFINGDYLNGAVYGINLNLSEGDHEYYFLAGDLENTVRFPEENNFLIIITDPPEEEPDDPPNDPPNLYNENTMNTENTSTLVNFLITYSDPEGLAPEFVKLIIDGIEYDMEFISGDFENGALYGINLTLSEGNHEYYFIAGDLENTVRFPEDDNFLITIEELQEDPTEDPTEDPIEEVPQNQNSNSNPKLSNAQVSQKKIYHYEFTITYSDNESDTPEYVRLFINETPYLMNFQYGDYRSGAVFICDIYLEAGNYTYYFMASDGKNFTRYPQIDFFSLNVTNLSEKMPEEASTKIINYIMEFIISLGAGGAGVSGFVFRNKQKAYQKILSNLV